MNSPASLQFLGAAGTVTGSRYLLETDGHRVLIDCGLFQGYKQLRDRNRAAFPVPPETIDTVLLTHAHLDHSGYIPALVRDGFRGKVICTPATAELCSLLLPDSGHLQEEEARFAKKRGYSKHADPQPLYTLEDAKASLEHIATQDFDKEFEVGRGIRARFLHAGHLLGAAQISVDIAGTSVHFSGDIGRAQDPLMRPPLPLAEADILVCESTYGNRKHRRIDAEAELAPVIRRVAGRGGVIVIPAFAVGRAQGIMLQIARLEQRGEIPAVPVFLNSPMAINATDIYHRFHDEHHVSVEECRAMDPIATLVRSVEESKALNLRRGPMIIVSASGMLTGGRVLHHVQAFGSDARNAILLSGFQAGGTRGAALAAGADHLRMFGRDVPIRAEVVQLESFSGHADADEILDWMRNARGAPRMTYLTHGEPDSADTLRGRINRELKWQARVPEHLERIDLGAAGMSDTHSRLRLVRAGIDTYQQPVVYMHRDCHVCRSEGFTALTRVLARSGDRELVATLNVVVDNRLEPDVAALSEAAWTFLQPGPEAWGVFSHPEPPASAGALRAKVFGQRLDEADFVALMRDTVDNRLSDIELTAFVTACAGERLDERETIALTKAMLSVGERIDWGSGPVLDKHCVGGLPGNRTTPIVVAIVAAAGHRIPKTSSRAITSPAGTADAMEVMAPVTLDLDAMRRVVDSEGGCIVWGGNVRLSPADDILIRIERPLDFDSDGQLVASILSKKAAAGSTHVLIDVPIGPTAKVRSVAAAASLEERLRATAQAFGLNLSVLRTDGSQPVGYGIGPALEARDVLSVLRNSAGAPRDLRSRALDLAGALLDAAPGAAAGKGRVLAQSLLDSGAALTKFLAICEAQGGFTEPREAAHSRPVFASSTGHIQRIDNRRLAKVAKLAGAPGSAAAGVDCRVRIGDSIQTGEPLFHIHAQSPGELEYALAYAAAHPDIFEIGAAE